MQSTDEEPPTKRQRYDTSLEDLTDALRGIESGDVETGLTRIVRNPLLDTVGHTKLIKKWKHPRLRLNLLQVAVVHGLLDSVVCLLRLGLWKDWDFLFVLNNGQTTFGNHPIHLAAWLGHATILEKLIWHFWIVRTGSEWVRNFLVERRGQVRVDGDSSLLRTSKNCPSECTAFGTFPELTLKTGDVACLAVFLKYLVNRISKTSPAPVWCIENVWKVQSLMSRRVDNAHIESMIRRLPRYKEFDAEDVLLICQLCHLMQSDASHHRHLNHAILRNICRESCSIDHLRTVVKYMTLRQMTSFCQEIDREMAYRQNSVGDRTEGCPCTHFLREAAIPTEILKQVKEMVVEEKQTRSLQWNCVLAVLKTVDGDMVRARRLPMPDGLRFCFPLPFQDLHPDYKRGEKTQETAASGKHLL